MENGSTGSSRFLIYFDGDLCCSALSRGHFVTHFTGTVQYGIPLSGWAEAFPFLLCSIRWLDDASLARNGAGGIRFSGVRTARVENDVQSYFRGNDPFPTNATARFSLGYLLMKIITACSLFVWIRGVGSNLSRATSLRVRVFEREIER